MPYITFALLFLFANSAWAGIQPVFDSPRTSMVYPSVSGDYLVYSQRVGQSYQVMRVKKDALYRSAKDISPSLNKEIIRSGVAIADGSIAYVSNRTGIILPWLPLQHHETAVATGIFQGLLMPNHLDVSSDGKTWVFDSSLESTRSPRLRKQFIDGRLAPQLLGQAWRMYHDKYWAIKTGYPHTKSGQKNKFFQPEIFMFKRGSSDISMLGNGFDASLSHDGKSMVFVRETNGNFDIWMQNTDGTGSKRLTKNTFADVEPALSPDGQHVAFVSNRNSNGDVLQTFIHVLNIATGEIKALTSGMGVVDGAPAWLNNNTIIFHSNRDLKARNTDTVDNWHLWTVALPK